MLSLRATNGFSQIYKSRAEEPPPARLSIVLFSLSQLSNFEGLYSDLCFEKRNHSSRSVSQLCTQIDPHGGAYRMCDIIDEITRTIYPSI